MKWGKLNQLRKGDFLGYAFLLTFFILFIYFDFLMFVFVIIFNARLISVSAASQSPTKFTWRLNSKYKFDSFKKVVVISEQLQVQNCQWTKQHDNSYKQFMGSWRFANAWQIASSNSSQIISV